MKIKIAAIVLVALFAITVSHSQQTQVQVFSPATVIELIQERISTIDSFTGSFTYRFDGNTFYGVIYYRAPNKFALEYSGGNRIISDGKLLWLVFKWDNIAIKEHLDTETSTPLVGWNISRLLREYVPTLPKRVTASITAALPPIGQVRT
jgi:outer membrane lipoprotein-sorting protein